MEVASLESIRFMVPCVPIAQPRQHHRVVQPKGGKPYAQNYLPERHAVHGFKTAVQVAARDRWHGPLLDGPLRLELLFLMPRPASLTKKKKPNPRLWCEKKPDLDNLFKAVADSLIGILYQDDRQIVQTSVTKLIADPTERPGVRICLKQLDPYLDIRDEINRSEYA